MEKLYTVEIMSRAGHEERELTLDEVIEAAREGINKSKWFELIVPGEPKPVFYKTIEKMEEHYDKLVREIKAATKLRVTSSFEGGEETTLRAARTLLMNLDEDELHELQDDIEELIWDSEDEQDMNEDELPCAESGNVTSGTKKELRTTLVNREDSDVIIRVGTDFVTFNYGHGSDAIARAMATALTVVTSVGPEFFGKMKIQEFENNEGITVDSCERGYLTPDNA